MAVNLDAAMPADTRRFTLLGSPTRVVRAFATNQIARFAPGLYVRLAGRTGRGAAAEEAPDDIAAYFRDCVDAYFERLGVAGGDVPSYLQGKVLMEYGPGDLPGVAALMVAKGASKVYCVDRFPLVNLSPKNARVVADLMEGCTDAERARLRACLLNPADPSAGFVPDRIEYLVRPSGLSGLNSAVDMVISRAVLEHVDDLDATFADMVKAMRVGAVAVHQVDLRSHGLHVSNRLDFLAWPSTLWRLMYSQKGAPNRWRVDAYRRLLTALPIRLHEFSPTTLADPEVVRSVRPLLAAPFRDLSDDDLAWLGIWLVFEKRVAEPEQ